MSEMGDYSSSVGGWKGHDFGDARKVFDRDAGRSYGDAVTGGKAQKDVLPRNLSTESKAPLVILCDVTGSMGEWPGVIFSKLPYLDNELRLYCGEDAEISFGAVGDAYCDTYPLQGRPFAKGPDMAKKLKELVIEQGGGGQRTETYELAALYYARNVSLPRAIKPILIFIGDEAPYGFVDKEHAKEIAYVDLQKRLSTAEIFEELKRKYSVYLIRKPFEQGDGDAPSSTDRQIHQEWARLVGEDHISILPEAGRVVDVIFGILARESGKIDYFQKELEDRQDPDQVKTVNKALRSIHLPDGSGRKKLPSGSSKMHQDGGGPKSKPLG